MAAPTFRGADFENGGNGTSTTLQPNGPNVAGAGTALTNDLMIAALYKENTAAYTATPTGWTQVAGFPVSQSSGGFKYQADLWWKRATAPEGDASWGWTGSTWRAGSAIWHTGCITTETPLVVVGTPLSNAGQNTEPTHGGITIARSNSGLLFVSWNFTNSAVTAAPTGFTARMGANDPECQWADDLTTVTGATGSVTGDLVNPEYSTAELIEIATEAAAGGATAPTGRRSPHRFFRRAA